TTLEQWIHFLRWAGSMDHVPECGVAPIRHAYEKALVANMTAEELEHYDKAGMAITDAKGALQLAREEGEAKGRQEGLEEGQRKGLEEGQRKGLEEGQRKGLEEGQKKGQSAMLLRLLTSRFGALPVGVREHVEAADPAALSRWFDRALEAATLDDVFRE
ncbi:MAG: hypothetical protein H7831_04910, partial [Magnetococcus sp. WYHC-3]